jgi:hypothetical protein
MNTSDIRPVAMTAQAVMEMAWSGAPKETSNSDGAYYRRWATEEFGGKSADALEEVYKLYFDAPVRQKPLAMPGMPSAALRMVGDQHYHTDARYFILDRLSGHQADELPSQSPKWSQPRVETPAEVAMLQAMREADIENCAAAQPRWDAVWNKAAAAEGLIDPARKNYYQAQVLTMIAINRESNRMLLDVARAVDDDDAGQTEKAQREIGDALAALDAVQQAMSAAEYGPWKNWYRGDWLTGVHRTHELVQAYANHLQYPMAPLPAPVEWAGWEGYFHIMEYEGDRTVDVH